MCIEFYGSQEELINIFQNSVIWRRVHEQYRYGLFAKCSGGGNGLVLAQCISTFDIFSKEFLSSNNARSLVSLKGQAMPSFWNTWDWVIACEQREGRGQYGRRWCGGLGNLYVSQFLPQDAGMQQSSWKVPDMLLPLLLSATVVKVLQKYHFLVALKWPNDIIQYAVQENGKSFCLGKVGGLLLKRDKHQVVLGLGLNCTAFDPSIEMEFAPFALPFSYLELGTLSLMDLWLECSKEFRIAWQVWSALEPIELKKEIDPVLAFCGQEVEFLQFRTSRKSQLPAEFDANNRVKMLGINHLGEVILERNGDLYNECYGSLRPLPSSLVI